MLNCLLLFFFEWQRRNIKVYFKLPIPVSQFVGKKKKTLLKVHLSFCQRVVSIDQYVKAAGNKDEIQTFQKNMPCLFYSYTFEN